MTPVTPPEALTGADLENLRILAGGAFGDPIREEADRERLTAWFCDLGLLTTRHGLMRRTGDPVLLTEAGRRLLIQRRESTAGLFYVAAIGHRRIAKPGSDGTLWICQTCAEHPGVAGGEWPCPAAVAYWPDYDLPTSPWQLAEVIGSIPPGGSDDDGIYQRLLAWHGETDGNRIYTAALRQHEQDGDIQQGRADLEQSVTSALESTESALLARNALATAGDAEHEDANTALGRLLTQAADLLTAAHALIARSHRGFNPPQKGSR